ncbi:MAG: mechanosensitive ion channel [Elusimicrobia bacterium]|nr:mechanosensitive ion channel [Elusimicrobiota bacterium]
MEYITLLLKSVGLPQQYVQFSSIAITTLLFILFLYIIFYLSKTLSKIFLNSKYFKLKSQRWMYALRETNFFAVCGYVAAGFIANFVSGIFFPEDHAQLHHFANKIINIYFLICIVIVINKILSIIQIVHDTKKEIPIKGFIQFLKIFINFFGFLIIFAYTIGKEPTYFVSALGIIASVLMIVFKDTILGLTAGWQISMNKMVKMGDWIEMPQHGADGNVVDISLTTVYVKNWDNRIVTIPAYSLISESFQNWRAMQEAGARRIKRSLFIDMQSVKFVDAAMLNKLRKFELLKEYIDDKEKEISEYNKNHDVKETMYNGRYLTNLGLFRIYCQQYIRTRSFINKNFSAFVRQLEPTPQGLPLEIYCFTNTADWLKYEAYQSDIFDHILSVIGEFDLFIFQNPTGRDFKKML